MRQNKTARRLVSVHCICQGSVNTSSIREISSKTLPSQYGAILSAIHTTGSAPAAAIRYSSRRLPCVPVVCSFLSRHQSLRTISYDLHKKVIDRFGGTFLSDLLTAKEIESVDQDTLLILIKLQSLCPITNSLPRLPVLFIPGAAVEFKRFLHLTVDRLS